MYKCFSIVKTNNWFGFIHEFNFFAGDFVEFIWIFSG